MPILLIMSRQVKWSRALIEQEKALLRKVVAETLDRVGSGAVPRLLSERIALLEGEFTP